MQHTVCPGNCKVLVLLEHKIQAVRPGREAQRGLGLGWKREALHSFGQGCVPRQTYLLSKVLWGCLPSGRGGIRWEMGHQALSVH